MRLLLAEMCVAVIVLCCCCEASQSKGGVSCIKNDLCTCTTDGSFNIDVTGPGRAIRNVTVSDSQGNKYTLSPCAPVQDCGMNISSQGVISACMWIKEKDRNVIIGESANYKWDVKSEYYFSVTYNGGSSDDSTTPRQTKLNYVVDDAVQNPEVEFLAMDEPTNTYIFNVRIKSYYSPAKHV